MAAIPMAEEEDDGLGDRGAAGLLRVDVRRQDLEGRLR